MVAAFVLLVGIAVTFPLCRAQAGDCCARAMGMHQIFLVFCSCGLYKSTEINFFARCIEMFQGR